MSDRWGWANTLDTRNTIRALVAFTRSVFRARFRKNQNSLV